MAFRDYSRLFGLADEQQRKRMPFGSQGAPDLFAGSSQHRFKIVVAHRNSAREPLHSCRGGSAASFLNSVK